MFDKIKDMLGGSKKNLGDLPLGGYEKYLKGVTYPIGLDDLKTAFRNNGAPDQVLGLLDKVGGKGKSTFSSEEDVVGSLKGELKSRM
ncbi:hypothetical protein BH24CHL3_BH24CHL3_04030 [soil metagenome]|jgi:hypothetical protein|nr:DUF2795 domain-containing protein [Chloroflexia bacterium]